MPPEQDTNPYAASAVLERAVAPGPPPTFFQKPVVIHFAWFLAVALNLPVPFSLGYPLVKASGSEPGLFAGIVAVYFAGLWGCTQWPGLMWRLLVGSIFTALSQFMPAAHMVIGLVAMGISREIFDLGRATDRIAFPSEAFSTTLLTGLGVIFLALSIGAALITIFRIKAFDANADLRIL